MVTTIDDAASAEYVTMVGMPSKAPQQKTDQRILDALKVGSFRRGRVQRRRYERDTRLDTDSAGTELDRHHRTEHART